MKDPDILYAIPKLLYTVWITWLTKWPDILHPDLFGVLNRMKLTRFCTILYSIRQIFWAQAPLI
jgi:hypothetical protein